VTDYFRALLLRHAAVSEDLAGDPFGVPQDPFAVTPSDRDPAALIEAPVAGRPTGFAASASPPLPALGLTTRQPTGPTAQGETSQPQRPAVPAGFAATMPPREPPLTRHADAALRTAAPPARAAGAPHAGPAGVPADVPPPVRPLEVAATLDAIASAEAASIPPRARRADAAGHGLPVATGRLHVMPEGDRTPVLAGRADDGRAEPTRPGFVAAPVPGRSTQGLPVPAPLAADPSSGPAGAVPEPPREPDAIMPAADPAMPGPHAGHDGATPPGTGTIAAHRHDAVAHTHVTGPVSSLDRAATTVANDASGDQAPEASDPGILQPQPHSVTPSPAPSPAQDAAASRVPQPFASPEAPKHGVRVSIDRLELRAASPAPARPAPARPAPAGRRIGLDDYAARLRTDRRTGAGP
jgi:hypothetical protein